MSAFEPRWDVALGEFESALWARGYYTSETISGLVKRVRMYAHECGHESPWDATPNRIRRWLDGQPVAASTTYQRRTALRTFYRWAVEGGRMASDPTEGLWGRRQELEAGPRWMLTIPSFLAHERAAGHTPATIQLRRYQIVTLGRTVGVADPWDVTADDLVQWFGTRGWSRSTLKTYRAAVRGFYRWGVKVGHVHEDPSGALPRVSEAPPVPRPADDSEIRHALAEASSRVQLLVRLQAELGLRIGEACKINRSDLQTGSDGAWLYVLGKGVKVRRLPLPDALARELALAPTSEVGFYFPGGKDGHLSSNYAGRLVSAALPAGVTPHALRHRFATQAYNQTHDVLAVQQLLGHASPATTQRYVAVPADNLRNLVTSVAV